jgi:hypothetical protein
MAICLMLLTLGIFYDNFVHFVFIWYFFCFWYHVPTKKDLATLELRVPLFALKQSSSLI